MICSRFTDQSLTIVSKSLGLIRMNAVNGLCKEDVGALKFESVDAISISTNGKYLVARQESKDDAENNLDFITFY